ncbi:MAG: class I fructose-bisphosphate aldolase [Anaerolineae bacterium]|nr:class I fructose-bisphosphate aldolase [Anaerolineae bacterium]
MHSNSSHLKKGILAADQPSWHLAERLEALNQPIQENTYRDWCHLLFSTPDLSAHVSGIIMHPEAVDLATDDGKSLVDVIRDHDIIAGISPSTGLVPLAGADGEVIGAGLDGLRERFATYAKLGIRFSKWRTAIRIGENIPSAYAIDANAYTLAQFAALSQEAGIVPIVEPEVELLGNHTIERCFEVTEWLLNRTFDALYQHGVQLEGTLLKANMVVSGADCPTQADVETVADLTVKVLRRTVPPAIRGIVFLSGGQTDLKATAHLNAMNANTTNPWAMTFSYARALQRAPLAAWLGNAQAVTQGQAALKHRANMNALASVGRWSTDLE